MAENSNIAWTHHTHNHWWGCMKVSEACKFCYAEALDKRWSGNLGGVAHWGVTAPRFLTGTSNRNKPLRWNKQAEKEGIRFRVFCSSMSDVFEHFDGPVVNNKAEIVKIMDYNVEPGNPKLRPMTLQDARMDLFEMFLKTPFLDKLVLTKRPENILSMMPASWTFNFPQHVWMGSTVEDQHNAELRIPHLLKVPASVRFLSCEPMLEPIDLRPYLGPDKINWVIVGGESGRNPREMKEQWARDIRDQCKVAGIPFFMKQGSENNWPDYSNFESFPADLQIREFPHSNNH